MIINDESKFTNLLNKQNTSILDKNRKELSFSAILQNEVKTNSVYQETDNNKKSIEELVEIFRKKGFKGFFKEIEKQKIEELREKILNEMGLTKEKLNKMPQEQRAAIEKRVSEEIQRRMALGSIDKYDEENKKVLVSPEEKNIAHFLSSEIVDDTKTSKNLLTPMQQIELMSPDEDKKDESRSA